tara:strand:- start:510 stop:779 length:270 start_codon:yes stop_codon:yes gene_type:complete|mmetsp:Transcript_35472/g.120161  ORF Transcript_35472/g.120161 Transcript_35472/m.120161 type:complete len:90 (-) Transcript_35472:491-760(-)
MLDYPRYEGSELFLQMCVPIQNHKCAIGNFASLQADWMASDLDEAHQQTQYIADRTKADKKDIVPVHVEEQMSPLPCLRLPERAEGLLT